MLDHIGHRKRFSCSSGSKQGSLVFATFKKGFDFLNSFDLISRWFI
jgi:hypothetical protein